MIKKVGRTAFFAFLIAIALLFTSAIGHTFFEGHVLTSDSFEMIEKINTELSSLVETETIYRDKEKLEFDVSNVVSPEILNKLNYLPLYKYYNTYAYAPDTAYLRKLLPVRRLRELAGKSFYDREVLERELRDLAKATVVESFAEDNIVTEEVEVYVFNDDLIMPAEVLNKLLSLKNVYFESEPELEREVKRTLGLDYHKKYYQTIVVAKAKFPEWASLTLKYAIILGIVSFIVLVICSLILSRNSSKELSNKLEKDIQTTRDEIKARPSEVLPVWDLAYKTLQQYFARNLSQVKNIFWLSVAVMTVGFFLIVWIILAPVFTEKNVELNKIGIIAGIITEFIGATFLFIYKSTINQALQHSKSLENINSVGMSIKILESIERSDLNQDKIDEAKIEVSKALINVHRNL